MDSERFEVNGLVVRIEQDSDAENPRDWDNLGTMVYWHRRYTLGGKSDVDGSKTYDSPAEFLAKAEAEGSVILPLYLYDHSGITMRTTPFSCPWDSGQVGHIYITAEKIRKEYGVKRITKQLRERVAGYLKNEVETFDQYLRGDVYGYTVEDQDGNHLDSCWGFFGEEYCKQEANRAAEAEAASIAKTDESINRTFAL